MLSANFCSALRAAHQFAGAGVVTYLHERFALRRLRAIAAQLAPMGSLGDIMHTIWEVLRDGNAKERLAVIADLVTIVGISIASIVTAIFTFNGKLNTETVFSMAILGLLWLAGYSLVLGVFLVISFYLSRFFEEFKTFRRLLLFALWLVFTALTLWVVFFAYSVLVHTTFAR